jgi:hypothetical protein
MANARRSSGEGEPIVLSPCPRQEIVELLHRPAIDELGEDVGEVGLRIDAVELRSFDQRCEACPVDRALVRAGAIVPGF